MWYPPYKTITDEELDEAIGLINARWYSMFYQLEEEDRQRIILQGKPLGYWLNRLDETDRKQIDGDR
jgi:hypothetical protein